MACDCKCCCEKQTLTEALYEYYITVFPQEQYEKWQLRIIEASRLLEERVKRLEEDRFK